MMTGNVEFVGPDEGDQAVGAEGVRHLELPGGDGANIAPSRPDHVDRTRFVRARLHTPFDPQGSLPGHTHGRDHGALRSGNCMLSISRPLSFEHNG